uniref:Hypothetical secreted peptide n=1 Tax=Glossina morsitans morsitans TaxID=37546 RepID=D3TSK0_GLOMM
MSLLFLLLDPFRYFSFLFYFIFLSLFHRAYAMRAVGAAYDACPAAALTIY